MEKKEAPTTQEKAEGKEVKTPENNGGQAAPVKDKSVNNPGASDAPSLEELNSMVTTLNEFDKFIGNSGQISDVPEGLRPAIKFMIEKLYMWRNLYEDPYYKAVNEDMDDQIADGQEPSYLVAIARTIPLEELQKLADNEDYAPYQQAISDEKAAKAAEAKSDEELYSKFEQSQSNIEAYCEKMGYDDVEKEDFYKVINLWRDVFADGLISEQDCQRIDKERNYDTDMESLKKQIPSAPTKEVIPDKSSVDASKVQVPQTNQSGQNSIESILQSQGTDWQNVGKRKFVKP